MTRLSLTFVPGETGDFRGFLAPDAGWVAAWFPLSLGLLVRAPGSLYPGFLVMGATDCFCICADSLKAKVKTSWGRAVIQTGLEVVLAFGPVMLSWGFT